MAGGLPEPIHGQLILGTDKRNPVFAIYVDDTGERLLVYYGFELLECVKNDREDPAFKLLLGRLYNAGINLRVLSEVFEVDPKTIRRWGKVLRQGDPVELIRVLEGRAAGRKRTLAVERFARLRWPYLVAEGSYGAIGRLLGEIEGVLEVRLSRSGVKDLIRELKHGTPSAEASEVSVAESAPLGGAEPDTPIPAEAWADFPPRSGARNQGDQYAVFPRRRRGAGAQYSIK